MSLALRRKRATKMLAAQRKRVSKVLAASPHAPFRRAIRKGVLPALEHQPVLAQLPAMAAVLDVGGNVGQFSLMARRHFPPAQILCFEPLPEAGRKIHELFDGDPRFELVGVALSDHAGSEEFHVTAADDSSSLLPVAARQVSEFPATREAETRSVPLTRLDDVLADRALPDGPMLLKIDTQGTELRVLRGAVDTLQRATHAIIEVSFVELYEGQDSAADITTFLVEQGWQLKAVYDVKTSVLNGEPIQADVLYERRR
jgi:FkbM family methyltransferase